MASKTILCVDDSVTMQKVAAITFAATEYEYVGARNADEGLSAARSKKPALVLVDAVMPGKTGYDLCEAIKADPELASVPVLVMCGNSQAYDPARGSAVGADGHVTKPWDTQVMLDKVAEVLGGNGEAPRAAAPSPRSGAAPAPKPMAAPTPAPMPPKPVAAPPKVAPTPNPQVQPGAQPFNPNKLPLGDMPEPPRSATIMGMPSLKLPPTRPNDSQLLPTPSLREDDKVTRRQNAFDPAPLPVTPSDSRKVTRRQEAFDPIPPRHRDEKPTQPRPMPVASAPRPVTPPPIARPAPAPVMPAPRANSAAMRPPMISGTPTRRPDIAALQAAATAPARPAPMPAPAPMAAPAPKLAAVPAVRPAALDAVSAAAESVAREAGLDPSGPEMAALLKLSREVIERVVWEVVPELAEAIIRENVDRLAKN